MDEGTKDPRPDPPAAGLSGEGAVVVADEVEMSARVGRRLALSLAPVAAGGEQGDPARGTAKTRQVDAEMVALRDQIADARAEDVPALLAQLMRSAGVRAVEGPRAQGAVDPRTPYFGHMRLIEGGRSRDVLIGKRGMIDRAAGVVIVDWRDAPVSRLYYRYDEGDEYEEELGDKVREGRVDVRRTVTHVDGALVRVRSPAGTFVRSEGAPWRALAPTRVPELAGGMGKAERAPAPVQRRLGAGAGLGDAHLRPDKHLPEITALIDRAQFVAMTEADSGVVVLQGGAGSGKTTVALHRIAWLAFNDPKHFRPAHMVVVVAQPQLARYVERLLPSLDVPGVRVLHFAGWLHGTTQRLLGKLGDVMDEVPSEVARGKKHPGVLWAIRAQLSRTLAAGEVALARAVEGRAGAERVPPRPAGAPLPALRAQREALRAAQLPDDTRERALRALDVTIDELGDVRRAHQELISDRGLLEACLDPRFGDERLDARALDELLRHTKRQVEERPDDSDIDADARVPIDDADEHATDPRGRLDVHDLPILLCLWHARHGEIGVHYDHAAVDEAQDLSAVEMWPLIAACGDRQSVTLAGDVVQRVVFDNGYNTWDELVGQLDSLLHKSVHALEPLRLSYRSTEQVVMFGRQVLGALAPPVAPHAVRSGAPVEAFSFADPGEEIAFLAEQLRALMAREPTANVALLARYPERARFYARMLMQADVPRLRLVLPADEHGEGDDFTFAPGIDVTTLSRTKGLEYDYVVLLELTEAMYPDDDASRHLLHIGATRAAHQLWITTIAGVQSELLPEELVQIG